MGMSPTTQQPITHLTALLLGYRRVVAVRTDILQDCSCSDITHLQITDWLAVTREEAVADIVERRHQYFTCEDDVVAILMVECSGLSRYVRFRPDCSQANNLLNLPRF